MYSLDINFLNDRPDYVTQKVKRKGGTIQVADRTALIAGVATGVFFPALVAGFWFVAQSNNQKLESQLAALEGQAGQLATKDNEYKAIKLRQRQMDWRCCLIPRSSRFQRFYKISATGCRQTFRLITLSKQ